MDFTIKACSGDMHGIICLPRGALTLSATRRHTSDSLQYCSSSALAPEKQSAIHKVSLIVHLAA